MKIFAIVLILLSVISIAINTIEITKLIKDYYYIITLWIMFILSLTMFISLINKLY